MTPQDVKAILQELQKINKSLGEMIEIFSIQKEIKNANGKSGEQKPAGNLSHSEN